MTDTPERRARKKEQDRLRQRRRRAKASPRTNGPVRLWSDDYASLLPLLKDMMTAGLVGVYWNAWHTTDAGKKLIGLDKRTLI